MYYRVSYNQEFYDLMMYLREKYGQEMFDLEGIGHQTDMHRFAKEFFSVSTTADASVDANANVDARDCIGYQWELPKPFFRMNSYFLLWEKLKDLFGLLTANRLIEKQFNGTYYINDFVDIGRPYCFNFSTYDLMLFGLPMVQKIKSAPPKYLYSFISQLENFVVLASNSILGATGLADLFVTMSYYVKNCLTNLADGHFNFDHPKDIWAYVKEQLVSFVYTINQPMRGNQSPFTNVSVFDEYFLRQIILGITFPDGTTPDIEVIQKIQEVYLDVMNEELERTPLTFPVTTACFSVEHEEIQDDNFAYTIAQKNAKWGFINIYHGATSTLSSCCRLRSETDNEYFNSFGAGSTKIGSVGVVTVNLPRLAWQSGTRESFLIGLIDLVAGCAKINYAKRAILDSRIAKGFMPLFTHGFMDLKRMYSTVGVTGINEACELLGYDILQPDGQDFVLDMLGNINEVNADCELKYNSPHNCEQVPAENSSIKLAKKDTLRMLNISHFDPVTGEPVQRYPFYSNQFIPLTTQADVLDRVKLQGLFDLHFSGGAICHVNMAERVTDPELTVAMIRHCARMGVVYWAVNYNLQECVNGHMSVGQKEVCSVCGHRIVNNFTRVVGFLTNTKNWHESRRVHDYPDRQFYNQNH